MEGELDQSVDLPLTAGGTAAAWMPRRAWRDRLERVAAVLSGEAGAGAGAFAATATGSDATDRKNMALLVQLRWIAVAGQIVTIAVVRFRFEIALPLAQMSLVLLALVALNGAAFAWLRAGWQVTGRALRVMLIFDVLALTAQLWLSGGSINPFLSLYLLQITLGAVLLDALSTWVLVALACVSVAGLTFSYRPLVLPTEVRADMLSLHITGMVACFVLDAVLLVMFVTRISRNLRERDAHLAALRQQAAEEDHIVRMGLLATGAAHELGTPLASLSVILGDWRRMRAVSGDAEMLQELEEMQTAIRRCKAIVTGILLSAGEARGEASEATTLNGFIEEIAREWRGVHATGVLTVFNRLQDTGLPVASDAIIKQAIFNILDNAFEASPARVSLGVDEVDNMLRLRVVDAGPGFDRTMLSQIGKPYQSSKGSPGSGLGLFLVANVARKLGGTVSARNLPQGGAEVILKLPLAALAIAARHHA